MTKVVVCGAVRTPIGSLGGGLSTILSADLATRTMKSLFETAKVDPKHVEHTSMGWVMQDPRSPNIAKTAAEFAGVPNTVAGTTIHENCASGGAAIHDIARRIQLGEIGLGVAGGVESMSNVPRFLYVARLKNQILGDMTLVDGLFGALTDTCVGKKGELMGLLTERIVKKYGLTRQEQDEVAFRSHANAIKAWKEGMFDYVTPVEIKTKKGVSTVAKDEGPKELTMEYFTKQQPYFLKDGNGTITSANSSSLNDGGAALLLASEERAKELGLTVLAELRSYGCVGVPRELMGEGAFKVVPKLMQRGKMETKDVDFFEMNEAFAAVAAAGIKDTPGVTADNINQWGSGISLGHPVGCTGARQAVDMIHQLRKRGKAVGCTTRCVGGGMGGGEVFVVNK